MPQTKNVFMDFKSIYRRNLIGDRSNAAEDIAALIEMIDPDEGKPESFIKMRQRVKQLEDENEELRGGIEDAMSNLRWLV